MGVLSATGAAPAPVLQDLLTHLANGDGWDTAVGAPVDEKTVTAATQPLSAADGSTPWTGDGSGGRLPPGDAGVQFDAFTAQHPNKNLATWTVWAGPGPDRPSCTLTASPHTPSALLADISEILAHGVGPRQPHPQLAPRVNHCAFVLPPSQPHQRPDSRRR